MYTTMFSIGICSYRCILKELAELTNNVNLLSDTMQTPGLEFYVHPKLYPGCAKLHGNCTSKYFVNSKVHMTVGNGLRAVPLNLRFVLGAYFRKFSRP